VTTIKRIRRRVLRARLASKARSSHSNKNSGGRPSDIDYAYSVVRSDDSVLATQSSSASYRGTNSSQDVYVGAPSTVTIQHDFSNNRFSPYVPDGFSAREWNAVLQKDSASAAAASSASSGPTPSKGRPPSSVFAGGGEPLPGLRESESDMSRTSMATTAVRHVSWSGVGGRPAFDSARGHAVPRTDTYNSSESSAMSDLRGAAAGGTLLGGDLYAADPAAAPASVCELSIHA
jgi:hypothetical protein